MRPRAILVDMFRDYNITFIECLLRARLRPKRTTFINAFNLHSNISLPDIIFYCLFFLCFLSLSVAPRFISIRTQRAVHHCVPSSSTGSGSQKILKGFVQ